MNFNTSAYEQPTAAPSHPGLPYGLPFDPKYFYRGVSDYRPAAVMLEQPQDQYHSPGWDRDLEEMLGLKRQVIDYKVQLVLAEIEQRRQVKESNLYRIDQDQCAIRNMVIWLGEHVWDKRRIQLEGRIWDLEEEKRKEQASYFKDLLFLNKEMRESLVEGLEERQKADLFLE